MKKTKLIQRQRLKSWTSAHVSESLIWWFASSYGNEVTTKISKRKTKLTFGWNNVQLCPQLLAIGTSSTPLVKLSLHSNTSSPVYDLFGLRHILQLTWIWIRKQHPVIDDYIKNMLAFQAHFISWQIREKAERIVHFHVYIFAYWRR